MTQPDDCCPGLDDPRCAPYGAHTHDCPVYLDYLVHLGLREREQPQSERPKSQYANDCDAAEKCVSDPRCEFWACSEACQRGGAEQDGDGRG